jgi:energy-coupling factor transporter ATP-binding protein EcfA2
MNLTISNYRGISRGDIVLHPKLTLIAGTNGSGKSSIAQALGCLLTGSTMPVIGVLKKHINQVLHNGSESAFATLNGYTITWPDCKLSGVSTHTSSQYAAGRCPPVDMEPNEWAQYLNASPTEGDLKNELPDDYESVWKRISSTSWNDAQAHYETEGQQLKGQWRQLTGQTYGSVQSPKWRPENLDTSGNDLVDGLAEAERLYELAIAAKALSQAESQELKRLSNDVPAATAKLVTLQTEMNERKAEWQDAQDDLKRTAPTPSGPATWECPKCAAVLCLANDQLHVHDGKKPSRQQVRDALLQRDTVIARVNDLYKQYEDSLDAYREAMAYADRCTKASKSSHVVTQGDDPAAAKKLVDILRSGIEAQKKWNEAQDLLAKIQRNATIQNVLSPEGLRKQVLKRSLTTINDALLKTSQAASWDTVSIGDNLDVRYGSRVYTLLSLSEMYRVNVTLQVVLAKIDHSSVLVIDAADILDADGRNGLISMLLTEGIPSVVTMTFGKKEDVPAISAFGRSYWVDGNTVQALP